MDDAFLVAITGVRAGDGLKRPGALFATSAEIAATLVAGEAARPAEEDDLPLDQAAPLADRRMKAIDAVLPDLVDDDFTAAGAPKVIVLRNLLGFVPTAEETALFKRPA